MGGWANDELWRAGEVDLRSCAPQLLMEEDFLPFFLRSPRLVARSSSHRGHERSAPALLTLSPSPRLSSLTAPLRRLSRSHACPGLGRGGVNLVGGLDWLSIARVGRNSHTIARLHLENWCVGSAVCRSIWPF